MSLKNGFNKVWVGLEDLKYQPSQKKKKESTNLKRHLPFEVNFFHISEKSFYFLFKMEREMGKKREGLNGHKQLLSCF